MEADRIGEWTLTRVAVREHTGRLTRRGHLHQLEWGEVQRAGRAPQAQGTASLLAMLEDMRPADLANVLQDLSDARRNEVAAALDDERLADVLGRAARARPGRDHRRARPGPGRRRARGDGPRRRGRPAGRAAEADREELLDLMEPDEASPVRALLAYQPGTAGSVMTSEPVVLTPDATVAEALARVREPQLHPAVAAQVFVARAPMATPTGRYLGMVHFQRLLREPPASMLGGIVDNGIDPLRPVDAAGRGHPADGDLQPGRRWRSSTTWTAWSARSPSTTCSTTCCRRTGATGTGPRDARRRGG